MVSKMFDCTRGKNIRPSLVRCWVTWRWWVTHYENTPIQIYWEFYHQKLKKIQLKTSGSFLISVLNIDCGYLLEPPWRGGSNEYPQSKFLSRNKKTNVYLCKPQFYCIRVGFKGSTLYRYVFVMWMIILPYLYHIGFPWRLCNSCYILHLLSYISTDRHQQSSVKVNK